MVVTWCRRLVENLSGDAIILDRGSAFTILLL